MPVETLRLKGMISNPIKTIRQAEFFSGKDYLKAFKMNRLSMQYKVGKPNFTII